jgi:hypothetical protein
LGLLASLGWWAACGEDSEAEPQKAGEGEACARADACAPGLFCFSRVCTDPDNAPQNNSDNNGDDNNGDDNADPNNSGNNDPDNNDPDNSDNNDPNNSSDPNNSNNPNNNAPDLPDEDVPDEDAPDEDASTPDTPAEGVSGGVSLFELQIQVNAFLTIKRANLGAAFVPPAELPPPDETLGGCAIGSFSGLDTDPVVGFDAGNVEVNIDGRAITLAPRAQGGGTLYNPGLPEDNEELFAPGDAISITAQGGAQVGAFSVALQAPQSHALQAPAVDATVGDEDLQVRWTRPNDAPQVVVTVSPIGNDFMPTAGPSISCTTDDAGSFTVPAAAMSRLTSPRAAVTVVKVYNQEVEVQGQTLTMNVTTAAGRLVQR